MVQQRDVLKAVRGRARLLRVAEHRETNGLSLCSQPQVAKTLGILRIEKIDCIESWKGLLCARCRRAVERDRSKTREHENPKCTQHRGDGLVLGANDTVHLRTPTRSPLFRTS